MMTLRDFLFLISVSKHVPVLSIIAQDLPEAAQKCNHKQHNKIGWMCIPIDIYRHFRHPAVTCACLRRFRAVFESIFEAIIGLFVKHGSTGACRGKDSAGIHVVLVEIAWIGGVFWVHLGCIFGGKYLR